MFLRDYRLASRPVTNGEYLEFVEDGGYTRPELWLSDGWTAVQRARLERAALLDRTLDGAWHEMTLSGLRPLDACDAGLPRELLRSRRLRALARRAPADRGRMGSRGGGEPIDGNFVESRRLPSAARASDAHDAQWYGDVWEWTASSYSPYPGYRPLEGALGEYNGKFMANQYVLRGGCCATPRSHMRATYRNFFYPPRSLAVHRNTPRRRDG